MVKIEKNKLIIEITDKIQPPEDLWNSYVYGLLDVIGTASQHEPLSDLYWVSELLKEMMPDKLTLPPKNEI